MNKKILSLLLITVFILAACVAPDETSSSDAFDASQTSSAESCENTSSVANDESSDEVASNISTTDDTSDDKSDDKSDDASIDESSYDESSDDVSSIHSNSSDDSIFGEPSSEDASSQTDTAKKEQVVDGLFIDANDRIMEVFSYSSKSTGGKTYAAIMNELYAKLKQQNSDIKLYSMTAPKACAYYLADSEMYAYKADCSLLAFKDIADNLDSNIYYVDVYNALLPHKDENIYFRTDYHWAPLGAFCAAQALAESAGVDFDDLSCYSENTRVGFLGALYSYVKLSRIKQNPDVFTIYKNTKYTYGTDYTVTYHDYSKFGNTYEHDIFYDIADSKYSSWYLTYLAGDSNAVHVKSNACKNGRRLVILKESFGNPLPAYLIGSFEEVWVLDIRYFNDNLLDFVSQYDITDVSVSISLPSAVGGKQNYIKSMTTQGR